MGFEEKMPICSSIPVLTRMSSIRTSSLSLFPSRSSVRTRAHAYANLFRRCISARLCVRQYTYIRVYICIYPVYIRGPDTPRGACAYSRGWSRRREDHKLNDVNALSTLYRNERRRHTTSSPGAHHFSLSVTATLPEPPPPPPWSRQSSPLPWRWTRLIIIIGTLARRAGWKRADDEENERAIYYVSSAKCDGCEMYLKLITICMIR